MRDCDCVDFLQWALPKLRLRWAGYRKVRRQVCKRVARRMRALAVPTLDAYQDYLGQHPKEWGRLDDCCHITISRFVRDRHVFDFLGAEVLPDLVHSCLQRGEQTLRVWSAGCGAGEEAYSLLLLWDFRVQERFPDVEIHVLATDLDSNSLRRAAKACYAGSSLKQLPDRWRRRAFQGRTSGACLRPEYQARVSFVSQDLRKEMPADRFDLILCRNLAFTYFNIDVQKQVLEEFGQHLTRGGALVIGSHERLPDAQSGFCGWSETDRVFRHCNGRTG